MCYIHSTHKPIHSIQPARTPICCWLCTHGYHVATAQAYGHTTQTNLCDLCMRKAMKPLWQIQSPRLRLESAAKATCPKISCGCNTVCRQSTPPPPPLPPMMPKPTEFVARTTLGTITLKPSDCTMPFGKKLLTQQVMF